MRPANAFSREACFLNSGRSGRDLRPERPPLPGKSPSSLRGQERIPPPRWALVLGLLLLFSVVLESKFSSAGSLLTPTFSTVKMQRWSLRAPRFPVWLALLASASQQSSDSGPWVHVKIWVLFSADLNSETNTCCVALPKPLCLSEPQIVHNNESCITYPSGLLEGNTSSVLPP